MGEESSLGMSSRLVEIPQPVVESSRSWLRALAELFLMERASNWICLSWESWSWACTFAVRHHKFAATAFVNKVSWRLPSLTKLHFARALSYLKWGARTLSLLSFPSVFVLIFGWEDFFVCRFLYFKMKSFFFLLLLVLIARQMKTKAQRNERKLQSVPAVCWEFFHNFMKPCRVLI